MPPTINDDVTSHKILLFKTGYELKKARFIKLKDIPHENPNDETI